MLQSVSLIYTVEGNALCGALDTANLGASNPDNPYQGENSSSQTRPGKNKPNRDPTRYTRLLGQLPPAVMPVAFINVRG